MEQLGIYLINEKTDHMWRLSTNKINVIGRGLNKKDQEDGIIKLPHPSVSREHAHIYLESAAHQWYLINKSRNGCKVNDKFIEEKILLKHGDEIVVGRELLLFYENFRSDQATEEIPIQGMTSFQGQNGNNIVENILIWIMILTAVVFFIFVIMKF